MLDIQTSGGIVGGFIIIQSKGEIGFHVYIRS